MIAPGLLASFADRRILVVGDVMLDKYLWGDSARISAEAPVPVVEIRARTYSAGGAANVAANIVGLAGVPVLVGVVGKDSPAARLVETLDGLGVPTDQLIEDASRPTTTKARLVARGQQIVRMDDECRHDLPLGPEQQLLGSIDRHLPNVDACILSDYGKGVVSDRVAGYLITAARKAGLPVIVDPKGTRYAKYGGATVIKPNLHEVERLLREDIPGHEELLTAGAQLIGLLEGCAVLITRGEDGMSLFREGAAPLHVSAAARNVFDVTGAGDTVIAVLAMVLATGAALDQAVAIANLAAGIVVGKRGTAAVTRAELHQALLEVDRFGEPGRNGFQAGLDGA